jgi:hypothetical protein
MGLHRVLSEEPLPALGRSSAMKVHVECVLPCPAEKAWDVVQRPALLLEVVRPLLGLAPVDAPRFPERWVEGSTVRCRSYLFGLIPFGVRTIFLERIDPAAGEIQTREHDRSIRRWDHLIRVRPAGEGRTRYSDEVVIEAGWATFLVWLFARWLYRHRQRRWREVARRLVAGEPGTPAGRSR